MAFLDDDDDDDVDVDGWLTRRFLVDGIGAVVDSRLLRTWRLVLASRAWTAVTGHWAQPFGFGASGGLDLDVCEAPLALAASRGLEAAWCAAAGDSRSGLLLFTPVGASVAATAAVRTADLVEVLPLLEVWGQGERG